MLSVLWSTAEGLSALHWQPAPAANANGGGLFTKRTALLKAHHCRALEAETLWDLAELMRAQDSERFKDAYLAEFDRLLLQALRARQEAEALETML